MDHHYGVMTAVGVGARQSGNNANMFKPRPPALYQQPPWHGRVVWVAREASSLKLLPISSQYQHKASRGRRDLSRLCVTTSESQPTVRAFKRCASLIRCTSFFSFFSFQKCPCRCVFPAQRPLVGRLVSADPQSEANSWQAWGDVFVKVRGEIKPDKNSCKKKQLALTASFFHVFFFIIYYPKQVI